MLPVTSVEHTVANSILIKGNNMSTLFITIAVILGLIFVVVYLKNTKKELRDMQVSTARDTATIGIVATATFAKDIIIATANAGRVAAKVVEKEHTEVIKSARVGVDNIIKDNGGTVKQAGVIIGKKVSSATYLKEANESLDTMLKDLKSEGY